MEKIENLVNLYNDGNITDYVLERELSEYLGSNITVKLSEKIHINNGRSYCIFPIPEKLIEGFHITYFLDREALRTYYNANEFALVLEKIIKVKQDILYSYNKFLTRTYGQAISYGTIISYLLDNYLTFKTSLLVKKETNFLPDDSTVRAIACKFEDGNYENSDLEEILNKNIMSSDILEYAKKFIREDNADVKISFVKKNTKEIPTVNLGYQETLPYVTSTFGIRDHKDIPYDYLPKTNQ